MQPDKDFILLRKRLGPSQVEFAEKIGVSRSTIADIERGRIRVSKRVKAKIVEIFPKESGYFDIKISRRVVKKTQGNESGLYQGPPKHAIKEITWIRRVHKDIKNEDPELYKLLVNIFLVSDFQEFIEDFREEYLREYWKMQFPSAYPISPSPLNYLEFKKEFMGGIKNFEYLSSILESLCGSIVQFYRDFAPLDHKQIIDNHFDRRE